MVRTAFVTIGQAPRDDVLASMFDPPLPGEAIQTGALDELDADEIATLSPGADDVPLVTRLRDGQEVLVSKTRLIPSLQGALDRAVAAGAGLLVVLCTGTFPSLTAPVPIAYPDRLLLATVNGLLPGGVLGVVMPHAGQAGMMERKWAAPERRVLLATASPYSSSGDLAACGRNLARQGADAIVLDCMGFDRAMKAAVSREAGVPVILANRLVGRVVEELAGV